MSILATLLAAFGGGVFGALIGGTTAFIFTGFLALTGIAVSLAGSGDIILNEVAFGPFFGPHVAFVGAVAAAAFAGRQSTNKIKKSIKKSNPASASAVMANDESAAALAEAEVEKFNAEVEVINGADTTIPLFKTNEPAVLLVGGLFGILGYLLNELFAANWALPIDTIALTVATFGIICRFIFGNSGLTGIFPQNEKRFNFSGKVLLFNAIWGFALAGLVAYVSILLDVNNLGFAISAASLIFLYFGLKFPVSHHVTMVAGFAALAFGNVWIAGLFGLFAVLTGEYVQRLVNTHVDTHLDMPAVVIATWSFVILGLLS